MNQMHHDEWISNKKECSSSSTTTTPRNFIPFVNLYVYQNVFEIVDPISNSYIYFRLLESHGLDWVWEK